MRSPSAAVEDRLDPIHEVRLLSNSEIASGVYALRFARGFEFTPGQVVAVALEPAAGSRFYSIASGCEEAEIELLYDLVPGGLLTPQLSRMHRGETLYVSDPFGSFVDSGPRAWWIATGTGIAPFLAMTRSAQHAGHRLVHGARTLDRFYYRSELGAALGTDYLCCCSTERASGIYPGRLTKWLKELDCLPEATRFMLCGGAGMVVEVRDILIAKGVPFDHIVSEIYF